MSRFVIGIVFATMFLFLVSTVYSQQYITGRQANQPIEFSTGYNFFGVDSSIGLSQDKIISAGCVLDTWNNPVTGAKLSYVNRLLSFSGSSAISRVTGNIASSGTAFLAYSENSCTVNVPQETTSIGSLNFKYGYNSFVTPVQITVGQLYTAGCNPVPWSYNGQNLGSDFDVFLTFAGTNSNPQRITNDTAQPLVGYLVYVNNPGGCQIPLPETASPQVSFTCQAGTVDCTNSVTTGSAVTISSGTTVLVTITANDAAYNIKQIFLQVSAPSSSSATPSKSCSYSPAVPGATCTIYITLTVPGQYQFYATAVSGADKYTLQSIIINVARVG